MSAQVQDENEVANEVQNVNEVVMNEEAEFIEEEAQAQPDELPTVRDSVHQPGEVLSLAQILPVVQQPVVSSPRLALFFVGLVYSEVQNKEFTDSTLYQLIKLVMETVESHKSLSGPEKKRLVLDVVRLVLVRKSMDEQVRTRCLALIDSGAVSEIIDLTIAASKGLVALNARAKTPTKCGARCVIS